MVVGEAEICVLGPAWMAGLGRVSVLDRVLTRLCPLKLGPNAIRQNRLPHSILQQFSVRRSHPRTTWSSEPNLNLPRLVKSRDIHRNPFPASHFHPPAAPAVLALPDH